MAVPGVQKIRNSMPDPMVILRMSSVHTGYLIFTKNVFFDDFLTNSGGFLHYYWCFFRTFQTTVHQSEHGNQTGLKFPIF